MSNPSFDIVVFGATSFVGQILSQYLFDQYGVSKVRWAMAGRSQQKLEEVRSQLGEGAADIPLIIADAADDEALASLCTQTQVVISTVGPYALYGEPMIRACCDSGTDYCDLTGEAQWIKKMQDRYAEKAKETGARVVHSCGFDSIPSDLGVHFLQHHAQAKFNSHCNNIIMRVKQLTGTASGGTIASVINLTKEAVADKKIRKEMANPYSCCPADHGFTVRQNHVGVSYDSEYNSWVAPFIMAAINTRIVHRSNALSGSAYGTDFMYEEAVIKGDGEKGEKRAKKAASDARKFMTLAAFAPTRWILERFILPKPGEGPTPEEQLNGSYDLRFMGTSPQGEKIEVKVTGDRDPGYGSTAKMLGQAACSIAFDIDQDTAGGFWTPATLLGDRLIERLKADAGLTFDVIG